MTATCLPYCLSHLIPQTVRGKPHWSQREKVPDVGYASIQRGLTPPQAAHTDYGWIRREEKPPRTTQSVLPEWARDELDPKRYRSPALQTSAKTLMDIIAQGLEENEQVCLEVYAHSLR